MESRRIGARREPYRLAHEASDASNGEHSNNATSSDVTQARWGDRKIKYEGACGEQHASYRVACHRRRDGARPDDRVSKGCGISEGKRRTDTPRVVEQTDSCECSRGRGPSDVTHRLDGSPVLVDAVDGARGWRKCVRVPHCIADEPLPKTSAAYNFVSSASFASRGAPNYALD